MGSCQRSLACWPLDPRQYVSDTRYRVKCFLHSLSCTSSKSSRSNRVTFSCRAGRLWSCACSCACACACVRACAFVCAQADQGTSWSDGQFGERSAAHGLTLPRPGSAAAPPLPSRQSIKRLQKQDRYQFHIALPLPSPPSAARSPLALFCASPTGVVHGCAWRAVPAARGAARSGCGSSWPCSLCCRREHRGQGCWADEHLTVQGQASALPSSSTRCRQQSGNKSEARPVCSMHTCCINRPAPPHQ